MKILEVTRPTKRDPNIDYEEVNKPKTSQNLDSIIIHLEGKHSAVYTKLAKRYANMKLDEKRLMAEKKELNVLLKGKVDELFPVADDVYTRVIDTVSMVIKVGKAEQAKTIDTFDAMGYIAEIEAMFPNLEAAMQAAKKKFQSVRQVAAKSPKLLTPKLKKIPANIGEGLGSNVMKFIDRMTQKIKGLLSNVDSSMVELNSRIDADIANG